MKRLAPVLVTALLAVACGSSPHTRPLSSLGPLEPAPPPGAPSGELVPVPPAPALASPTAGSAKGKPVGGIECQFNERVAFHVHAHLTLFVNGKQRAVPAGIGIWPPIGPENYRDGQFGVVAQNCFYWLATRYADGLIHIEAPMQRAFTLGDFFDVWGQQLSRTRLGPARGNVTAIVNGEVWTGDPREVPLTAHAQIQLEAGTPLVAPQTIEFPGAF